MTDRPDQPTRPAWDSDEQREWNRANHGRRVRVRFPTLHTNGHGDPEQMGYREFEAVLNTDPDSADLLPGSTAVWLDEGEMILDPDATT